MDKVNFILYKHHTNGRSPKDVIDDIIIGKDCVFNITSYPCDGITAIYVVVLYLMTDRLVNQDCLVEFLRD